MSFIKRTILHDVVPVLLTAVPIGFFIRMNYRLKHAFALCLIFSFANEVLKFLVCTIIGVNYLFISVDCIIYTLTGCLLGVGILWILRSIIKSMEFESDLLASMKKLILEK